VTSSTTTRRGPARVVLVYDSTCGACTAIARRAGRVFGRPVALRSCRDPNLGDEYPPLRPWLGVAPCRRPLLVVVRPDGPVHVAGGLRLLWRAALLVPVARWPAAAVLVARVGWSRLGRARTP